MAGDKGDNYETISNIEVKYLKDNEGKIISPVVSSESVFCPGEDAMLKDKINAIDSKLVAVSQSQAGFMSAADKTKLDGITESADSVSFTRSLTAGTKVGDLTINGTTTSLYAPTPPSSVSFSSLVPVKHTILSNTNYGPNDGTTNTIAVKKSGYYPIGFVGITSSGISEYYMTSASLGVANIYFKAYNGNPHTITCFLNIWVLWAK